MSGKALAAGGIARPAASVLPLTTHDLRLEDALVTRLRNSLARVSPLAPSEIRPLIMLRSGPEQAPKGKRQSDAKIVLGKSSAPSFLLPANGNEAHRQKLEDALVKLEAGKRRLAKLTISQRIELLHRCLQGVSGVAREWVEAACSAKGITPNSPSRAEEVLGGPVATLRQLQLFIRSMRDIERSGVPSLPKVVTHPDGKRVGVQATPCPGLFDPFVFFGFRATTWLDASVTPDNLRQSLAPAYQGLGKTGLSLVLGAGNVASISLTDVLTKLCVDNRVVLLKMNPVNEYLTPFFERAFAPLVENDLLQIVCGDAALAAAAIADDRVDDVHITGSDKTHNSIVWGPPGEDRVRRQQTKQPLLQKPITSELGNVTPWIVVPGQYSRGTLRSQVGNIVSSMTNNAAFNCVATRVIVTWKQWPQRDQFLRLIESGLAGCPQRKAYYPGAVERYGQFVGIDPDDAQKHLRSGTPSSHGLFNSKTRADGTTLFFGGTGIRDDSMPWTLICNVNPKDASPLFCVESFVCVCVEVTIDADSPEEFLDRATDFANEKLWGTLSASITVPSAFRGVRRSRDCLQAAIDRLRYGIVAINQWSGLGFGLMSPPWGGYPGSTLEEPQSGTGWVHNSLMLTGIEKTVVEGPLVVFPKPVWMPSHQRPESVAWSLFELFRNPSLLNVSKLSMAATLGALARSP